MVVTGYDKKVCKAVIYEAICYGVYRDSQKKFKDRIHKVELDGDYSVE